MNEKEMKVLQEKDNQLLGRKEVTLEMSHMAAATPAKASIVKELAAKYGVPEENVVIDYVFTKKGVASSEVKAKIYKEKPKVKEKKAKEAKGAKEAREVKKSEEVKKEGEGEKGEAQAGKPV